MTQPPAKRVRLSSSSSTGSGGFHLLHQHSVSWTLYDFHGLFLKSKQNLCYLDRNGHEFTVDAFEQYPSTKWKLSLVVGPPPDLPSHSGARSAFIPEDWVISYKLDLLSPSKDLGEVLFVRIKCGWDLFRESCIVSRFPEGALIEFGGTQRGRNLLPLCTVAGRGDVLSTGLFSSNLTLKPTFEFLSTNLKLPEIPTKTEEEDMKRWLGDMARWRSQTYFTRDGAEKVVVILKGGTELLVPRDLLRAYSSKMNDMLSNGVKQGACDFIHLDFDAAIVKWIIQFMQATDVNPYSVKIDGHDHVCGAEDGLPDVAEIIRFSHEYKIDELIHYFDFKLPSLCAGDPSLAPHLKDVAIKFGLKKAEGKITTLMGRGGKGKQ